MSQGRAATAASVRSALREVGCIGDGRQRGIAGAHFMSIVEVNATKALFGWPLYATWNALAFVSVQPGRLAKTLTLLSFLPVLFFTATHWSALWAVVIWSVAVTVSLLAF